MPKPQPKKISPRLVERHEVLFPKLQAFARSMQANAGRRPNGAVPADVRAAAEALLFEVQPFRQQPGRRALPVAAPHYGGLAGQLAEALAALVAFETRHSHWDARFSEPVWSVSGHETRKLRRLSPRPGSRAATKAAARAEMEKAGRAARMLDIRARLVKRLDQYKLRMQGPPGEPLSPGGGGDFRAGEWVNAIPTVPPTRPPAEEGCVYFERFFIPTKSFPRKREPLF